jgi:hypothetical protein
MEIKKEGEEDSAAKKEEELWTEEGEETPTEENGLSNRHLYAAFIPPLTNLTLSAALASGQESTALSPRARAPVSEPLPPGPRPAGGASRETRPHCPPDPEPTGKRGVLKMVNTRDVAEGEVEALDNGQFVSVMDRGGLLRGRVL